MPGRLSDFALRAGVAAISLSVASSPAKTRETTDPALPPASPARLAELALDSPKLDAEAAWKAGARPHSRPNVVLVTLESVGAKRVGFLGYPRDVTPNLDRIAAESLVFERAYTTATHSNYAQMAILSSLFPRRGTTLDMYGRIDYPRHLLHDLTYGFGYRTATISSQDESWQGMLRYQTTDTPTFVWHSPDFKGKHLSQISDDVVPDDATVDEAISWIDAQAGEPFSLYVNLQSTHFPYPLPEKAGRPFAPFEPKGRFDFLHWDPADEQAIVNRYDDALHYVDEQVGRLWDALAARGLLERTIVVVAADHGEMIFDHDMVTHGRTLFDDETRVPLLVHEPLPDIRRVRAPVSTLDVVPTVLDMLGVAPHPGLQGESVRRAGLPGAAPHAAIFMNVQGWRHLDAVVCLPFKLISDPENGTRALYELDRDPGETRDAALDEPAATSALEELLAAQIEAQQRYHADTEEGRALRGDRFAPIILPCPRWPDAVERRAEAMSTSPE